jgi:apolipoprotein N-acyltransferase
VPYSLEAEPEVRDVIGRVVGPGGHVILGSDFYDPSVEPPLLHNSVYTVAADGAILARYDKVELVPFGEFLPFRTLFGRLGLEALAVGSLDFMAGEDRTTIAVDGLAPFSPLVCYEAAFPARATDGTGQARWIVNVTNDAWFGISSGPHQHAGMARMRAVESGLPLVRAANTGISLVTDAKGRILEQLPLGAMGTIDTPLPPALATPPLASGVPWSVAVLIALGLAVAAACEAAARRKHLLAHAG